MRVEHAATALVVFLSCAVLVSADQSITLEFRDGHVWLAARDAPVREILKEWARLGGATIVNGDALEGAPVTLELVGVPERQVLDVILRDVPGYILAARPVGSAGSTFDRIVIMPRTTSPPPPAPAVAARRPTGAGQPKNGLPEPLVSLLGSGLMGVADVHPADPDGVERDAGEPDNALPEPLGSFLGSGFTGIAEVQPANLDGVERGAKLPEALADTLRSVTDAAMPETAPRSP